MDLLEVKDLSVTNKHTMEKIISNISFSLKSNSCLAIVGESGSGKTITGKSILDILDPWLDLQGTIYFNGRLVYKGDFNSLFTIRGKKIFMIMQDAMTAFDPLYTIGAQFIETIFTNFKISKTDAINLSVESLHRLGIDNGWEVLKKFPHQLSGGMLQRCMIAMALIIKPSIIIADEPTTSLDAIHKGNVVKELKLLRRETGTSIILISHDFGVVQQLANNILVLKNGVCIEYGAAEKVIGTPKTSYTKYLIESRLALSNPFNTIMNRGRSHVENERCI